MANIYCSSCGVSMMSSMRICPSCGGKALSPTPPMSQPQVTQKSSFQTGQNLNHLNQSNLVPSGYWQRLGAYVLDTIIVFIIAFLMGLILGIVLELIFKPSESTLTALSYLLGFAIQFTYYTYFHSSVSGATPGKKAFDIKVVTQFGERLTKSQAFTRILAQSLIPLIGLVILGLSAFGIGSLFDNSDITMAIIFLIGFVVVSFGPYMPVFFNSQRKTLIDIIFKTLVIKKL